MIVLYLFVSAALALSAWHALLHPTAQGAMTNSPLISSEESSPELPPSIDFRVSFGSGPGTEVTGWPSKGGIYILTSCLGVELDFLELDRFRDTERPSTSDADSRSDEEAHCNRSEFQSPQQLFKYQGTYLSLLKWQVLILAIIVRQLGATWWDSEHEYNLSWLAYSKPTDSFIRVGWPAGGGVWVLKTTLEGASQKGAAMIQNAYSMEERCRVIEQVGGIFYANPKDCPDLDLP
jgi:hypothetical protein